MKCLYRLVIIKVLCAFTVLNWGAFDLKVLYIQREYLRIAQLKTKQEAVSKALGINITLIKSTKNITRRHMFTLHALRGLATAGHVVVTESLSNSGTASNAVVKLATAGAVVVGSAFLADAANTPADNQASFTMHMETLVRGASHSNVEVARMANRLVLDGSPLNNLTQEWSPNTFDEAKVTEAARNKSFCVKDHEHYGQSQWRDVLPKIKD